ncbi:DUF4326 domain-containing protein [Mycobacterium hackensackense]|uniref:DUF4326 domain-containing protein n=1 Tax=Mycobacterium hackensackense TaxID=228909 RepID=UPI0022659346|nr:DUF4326 domain-containing protein [Mycobacterium hackensackense]MCV7255288.1 DUF4326 domain-containing protein [Mycobacterium hackensackense]
MPERIQRRRTKGWRTPLCGCGCGKKARFVGRGTPYGNPFHVGGLTHFLRLGCWTPVNIPDAETAASLYRNWVNLDVGYSTGTQTPTAEQLAALRGHDLVCWCPTYSPCHGDVLLELANA